MGLRGMIEDHERLRLQETQQSVQDLTEQLQKSQSVNRELTEELQSAQSTIQRLTTVLQAQSQMLSGIIGSIKQNVPSLWRSLPQEVRDYRSNTPQTLEMHTSQNNLSAAQLFMDQIREGSKPQQTATPSDKQSIKPRAQNSAQGPTRTAHRDRPKMPMPQRKQYRPYQPPKPFQPGTREG